jgi:hypothetical protein
MPRTGVATCSRCGHPPLPLPLTPTLPPPPPPPRPLPPTPTPSPTPTPNPNPNLLEDALGVVHRLDLNALNHCAQRFESASALAAARDKYCVTMATRGAWVEDAVTGRVLQIEEQLLNIEMAAG